MTTFGISAYRDSDKVDRHGIACDFVITKRPTGPYTIVQNLSVEMRVVNSAGKPDEYIKSYSEQWHVPKKDRYNPQTDTFAIPLDWRVDHKGYYQIEATAYLVKKKPTGYELGKVGDKPWGTTPGTWTLFKPDADKILGEVRRVVRIEWDNTTSSTGKRKGKRKRKRKNKNLAKGEDLTVVLNKTMPP